jgi:DNA-directed RNA polymerase specialized sigma24 family protein
VELPDADVIRQYLRTQDPAYFSILYRKYAGKVYGKCLSILKEEELARDAMQEIFMDLFNYV